MRGHLRAAADLNQHAADADTLAEAHKFVGLAMKQLVDAAFWLERMERDVACQPLELDDGDARHPHGA